MVAYSFQRRFVDYLQAGLEPGPWCPGMKRHTLRAPRTGRGQHARPEQAVQLYTGMRTRHCRLIGKAVCRLQIPVQVLSDGEAFTLCRREGAAPRSYIAQAAPIVRALLDRAIGAAFSAEEMDEFARTDGFSSTAEMRAFFEPPNDGLAYHQDMVLIGWAPGEPYVQPRGP